MSAHRELRRPAWRYLTCDHDDGCGNRVRGVYLESVVELRGRACQDGWWCQNSGPGHPARDLCAAHRPDTIGGER